MYNSKLNKQINKAIGWGAPDNESTGYSYNNWVKLINNMESYILKLEKLVDPVILKEINRPSNYDDL